MIAKRGGLTDRHGVPRAFSMKPSLFGRVAATMSTGNAEPRKTSGDTVPAALGTPALRILALPYVPADYGTYGIIWAAAMPSAIHTDRRRNAHDMRQTSQVSNCQAAASLWCLHAVVSL